MAFLSALNISASGMTAERMRLDVVSENISNLKTTRTEDGGPYKRKMVVFETVKDRSFQEVLNGAARGVRGRNGQKIGSIGAAGGVRVSEIVEDDRDFKPVYDPLHPDADIDGYVMMPNIDLVKETIDGMSASRGYDANLTAFNAIKAMASKALEIGR
ncbi:flagellar basal body rod protein FlgC [Clostridium sp. MD294]|uniref:flagellar basal body rod protein FlgC n=1 Tax=Clostridium sp. MD294 TaxID=97138 RepID=UPI0002C95EF5|nr:flagellar basal body rod protein FlgC [Clostridium sp. MD294]NDO46386.1 flagellar basal body rod protein FlgC [Clostridium sp. MD294]USF29185.1 Flagellar basal-body rod protein FlgC [Clostridium sp. MD294]